MTNVLYQRNFITINLIPLEELPQCVGTRLLKNANSNSKRSILNNAGSVHLAMFVL